MRKPIIAVCVLMLAWAVLFPPKAVYWDAHGDTVEVYGTPMIQRRFLVESGSDAVVIVTAAWVKQIGITFVIVAAVVASVLVSGANAKRRDSESRGNGNQAPTAVETGPAPVALESLGDIDIASLDEDRQLPAAVLVKRFDAKTGRLLFDVQLRKRIRYAYLGSAGESHPGMVVIAAGGNLFLAKGADLGQ